MLTHSTNNDIDKSESEAANNSSNSQLDKSQIFETNEPVIFEDTKMGLKMEVTISDVSITRNLLENFKSEIEPRSYLKYSDSVVTDDYTFNKDFYYLNMTVNVKNTGIDTFYVLNRLTYVTNEDGQMSYADVDSKYNESKYNSLVCSFNETDNKNIINGGLIRKFSTNDEVTYEVCYIITDVSVENNNVYLMFPFGRLPQYVFADKDQKYIKVDIGNNHE